MLELLQQLGTKYQFNVATMDELAEFNHVDNLQGKKYRVLVADTLQCSEGVNFFAVRRMFLTDVPSSPSQLVQQVGRALRLYSHRGLPEKEQTRPALPEPLDCPLCPPATAGARQFSTTRSYRIHMRRAHQYRDTNFYFRTTLVCYQCRTSFFAWTYLLRHLRF